MKQVLVDMHRLKHHPYNGLYTFSAELGRALAARQWPGMQLHMYVPPEKFGFFGDKVTYASHHSRDKFYRFGTGKFDVWHATTTLSWYRPFNRKTKFVFTLHDLNFLEETDRSQRHRDRYLRLIRERVKRADFVTYISEYTRRYAAQYLDLENKPGRVIYNGCNVPLTKDYNTPAYFPAKPYLFSIGLCVPRKNFHVLPALLQHNDYELVIAGLNDLPYAEEVLKSAKKMGVANRVHLVGPVSESEKYWYYQNCKAFVFPSVGEGFGLPVLEAMWFGKPVFLSTATCLPEIGGDAAYYFQDFSPEHMQQVFEAGMQNFCATNPQENIRQRAAAFSWEKAAEQYVQVYRDVSAV